MEHLILTGETIPNQADYMAVVSTLEQQEQKKMDRIEYSWLRGRPKAEIKWNPIPLLTSGTGCGKVRQVVGESAYYDYLLYLPEGYDPGKKWPVIYFLHGISQRGNDVSDLLKIGMPRYLADGGKVNAIMIAPQCPLESHWADTDLEVESHLPHFLAEMARQYAIDPNRVYATGLSMGGRGTWKLALAMPEQFAAIAVVCGRTNTYEMERLQQTPIWMIHGVQDPVVSFRNIYPILGALQASHHPEYHLTVYPYGEHDVWEQAYGHPALYNWLLSHVAQRNSGIDEPATATPSGRKS